jgi:Ca2+-transporting ATPase
VIFANIRRFMIYLLSCNLSEVLVVGLAVLAGLPLPLLPLQILFLNLVTDVFPAFALGVGEGDKHVLQRPPRNPKEQILERNHWSAIVAFSLAITAATLGASLFAQTYLGSTGKQIITVSFLTLALAQLWHVFNMRDPDDGLLRNVVTMNPFVWGALLLCALILLAAVYIPWLASLLHIVEPTSSEWTLILISSLMPLAAGQAWKSLQNGSRSNQPLPAVARH